MWKIIDLEYRLSDGIATKVTAEYRLTSGNVIARDILYIDLPEPTSDIIPFNELTEEQVIIWLKSLYPTTEIEDKVLVELNRLVEIENNKGTDNKLPWVY